MDVVFTHCAGLDVHKKRLTACRVSPEPTGQEADGLRDGRDFGTLTMELLALSDWLREVGVTHVALESTGEYWQPVSNLLEGNFTVVLVTAAHVKNVPGRKTDKAAARWLAKLMRYGLLHASFIPPQGQRDLRDLTRYRAQLVQERRREVNRVHGVLERANIKLASVVTDIMGVSGRAMLDALIAGRPDPATMAEVARGRMRSKLPMLEQALTGVVREPHRRLLALQRAHVDFLDEQIATRSQEMQHALTILSPGAPPVSTTAGAGDTSFAPEVDVGPEDTATPMTFTRAITVLDRIPGVHQQGAELMGAEWGIDMGRFGTAARLAAWSGVAPGHNESAGLQRSGKTRKGNRALRTGLVHMAHAAARCRAAGISPTRSAIARMATSSLTFHRDNVIQDPSYGLVTSWDRLMGDAAVEIDQTMAATAWERALRDSYVSQHVYIIMFLVLDCRAYRERLLIDERPRVQSWHERLVDLVATVMQEHGQSTPRSAALAQRGTAGTPWAWICARFVSRQHNTTPPAKATLRQSQIGNLGNGQ